MRRTGWSWLGAAVILTLMLHVPRAGAQEWDQLREQQDQYTDEAGRIRAEQEQVLADLFALNRTLQEIEIDLKRLAVEISQSEQSLAALQAEAARLRADYQLRLNRFGDRLRYMYRYGTISYLEVLLEAADFRDFLERVDLLDKVVAHDAHLLAELKELRAGVARQEERARQEHQHLVSLRDQSAARRVELRQHIAARESRLAALQQQRAAVEAELAVLERIWQESAVPVLERFSQGFHTLSVQAGELEPDALQLEAFGATVVISEATLNGFLARYPEFGSLRFRLAPGQADLTGELSGVSLEIIGGFAIHTDTVLRYTAREIRFFEVPLPPATTQSLVSSGRLDVDFSGLLSGWRLKQVVHEQGRLVGRVGP